ncbi:MAG: hypothetical protein WDM85_15575 [Caulobacteraceae bacterium]
MSNSDFSSGVDAQFIGAVSPTAPRIQAGGHPCQGIYWTPKGQRPRTALIATTTTSTSPSTTARPTSPGAGSASWAGTRATGARRTSSSSSTR